MKRSKTSLAKKKKKVPEALVEESIIVRAKREKEQSVSEAKRKEALGESSRPLTKDIFKMWCVLPDTFKGAPERITELLGITDSVTMELLKIKTMQQFADEFGVIPQTLSRWRKEVETSNDYLTEVKRTFKPLTKNLMAALYRKGLKEGDAQRMLAYMKIVEDWREQLGIEHSGTVGEGLSPEEKAALDNLLKKNLRT